MLNNYYDTIEDTFIPTTMYHVMVSFYLTEKSVLTFMMFLKKLNGNVIISENLRYTAGRNPKMF